MATIFISAAEVSGDRYGAHLIEALKQQDPSLTIVGVGGEHMKKAGARLITDITQFSTIGVIEPLQFLPKLIREIHRIKSELKTNPPQLFVPIDAQGLHMHLLKTTKQLHIPSVYYITPQEWLWGTEKGGRKVIQLTTTLLAIFKEEAAFYQKLGGKAPFIGHPLLDIVKPTLSKSTLYNTLNLNPKQEILAIFPGSRKQELLLTGKELLKTAEQFQQTHPECHILISCASPYCQSIIKKQLNQFHFHTPPILYTNNPYNAIAHAKLSLTTSGTVTLEHALLKTPCIVGYKFSPLSYQLAKLVLGKRRQRIPYISLPNLITKEPLLPEFLQNDCTVPNLLATLTRLWDTPSEYATCIKDLDKVTTLLGKPGAIKRAATELITTLQNN